MKLLLVKKTLFAKILVAHFFITISFPKALTDSTNSLNAMRAEEFIV